MRYGRGNYCDGKVGRANAHRELQGHGGSFDVKADGKVVQTLVRERPTRKGWFRVRWDGRDTAGRPFPEGSYKPRVHLGRARRREPLGRARLVQSIRTRYPS